MNNPKEKDEKLQYKISLVILVFALVFVCFFATYAFFIVPNSSKNEEVTVSSGNLSLVFADGNPGFSKQLEFGQSAEKTFTIENNGTLDAVAKISWKNLTNNYLGGSLTYTLSYSETETGTYTEIVTNKNVPRSETPETLSLANGLEIPIGKTYYYKLVITLNYTDFNQTDDLKATLNTEFSIEEEKTGENLVQALLAKTNDVSITDYNSGVKEEMFTFTHPEAEQTTGWSDTERMDYRYIGVSPNNYINFNDETWRIIGVFTVENEVGVKEQRVKIIREASIGNLEWDSIGKNEWSTSSLAIMLNGDYVNSGGSFTYTWYEITADGSDVLPQILTVQGLNSTAKSQLAPAKWYLGGSSEYENLGGTDFYNFERGITTCVITGNCSGQTRSTSAIANVGLMYPSDYVYTYSNGVDNTCYTDGYNCGTGVKTNGWLYNSLSTSTEWLISPSASDSNNAFIRSSDGDVNIDRLDSYIFAYAYTKNIYASRPCVYLRADIKTIGGTGASDDMYILES